MVPLTASPIQGLNQGIRPKRPELIRHGTVRYSRCYRVVTALRTSPAVNSPVTIHRKLYNDLQLRTGLPSAHSIAALPSGILISVVIAAVLRYGMALSHE